MDKLEKVINGLECCTHLGCHHGCAYLNNERCRSLLEKDTIELLKEQKEFIEKKQHDIDQMCYENSRLRHLLNDKQPRKVNNIRALTNVSKCGECPSCGGRVYTTANKNFCGQCGDRIDWEDGEQE